jgi:outer membrane protein
MKAALLLTGVLGLHGLNAAWGAQLRFDDLPRLVRERNSHAQATRAREAAALARTGHLRRSYLPKVHASGGVESFQGSGVGDATQPFGRIEARANLFRGGKDSLQEVALAATARAASLDSQGSLLGEITKTRLAFWQVVYYRELDRLLADALTRNERHQAAAQQRIQAGMATRTDTLEFRMNRVQLSQDQTHARIESASAEGTLRALVGLEAGEKVEIGEPLPHVHEDPLLSRALDVGGHRTLLALDAQLESTRASQALASRWWVPSLDLYGSYSLYTRQEREFAALRDRREAAAGVLLSLPLFDGLEGRAARRATALEVDAIDLEREQTGKELTASFQSARNALQLTHSLLDAAEEGARLADEYLAQSLQEYRRGLKNSPDVLGAVQKNLELKRRSLDLRRDYQVARATLLSLLGD